MTTDQGSIVVRSAQDVGELAREARLQAGLSQAALARAAGVGRQWLNEFELGKKSSAPIDMILRVFAQTKAVLTVALPVDASWDNSPHYSGDHNDDGDIDVDKIVDPPSFLI